MIRLTSHTNFRRWERNGRKGYDDRRPSGPTIETPAYQDEPERETTRIECGDWWNETRFHSWNPTGYREYRESLNER